MINQETALAPRPDPLRAAVPAAAGADGNGLAEAPDYIPVAGYEQLDPDDFSLPTLKLVQAQTTADGAQAHLGQYYKTDTGEFYTDPAALIVAIAKSRIMFPTKYESDNQPLCRSDNAIQPRVEFFGAVIANQIIPESCAECPFTRFPDEGGAPPCSMSDNWAAILETGDIAIVRFKGASSKTSLMLKNLMRVNRMKRRPTYIRLGSKFERGDSGQYYVSTVVALREAPPPAVMELASQIAGLNLAARAVDEDLADARARHQRSSSGFDEPPPVDDEDLPF